MKRTLRWVPGRYLKPIPLIIIFALSAAGQKAGSLPSLPVLPGEANSQKLEKLFQRVESEADTKGFTITFGMPLDKDSRYLGRTTYQYNEINIRIRDGTSGELRENALAHELLHAELKTEGFASNFRETADQDLNFLSESLLDCVNHQVLDPRLRAAGFKPELVWQGLVDDAEHFQGPADSNRTKITGLIVYCLSLHVDATTMSSVESAVNKVQPSIVDYAHHLRTCFGDLPCDDPDTCFQQTKKLRDELGNPDVKFGNPKTNFAE